MLEEPQKGTEKDLFSRRWSFSLVVLTVVSDYMLRKHIFASVRPCYSAAHKSHFTASLLKYFTEV